MDTQDHNKKNVSSGQDNHNVHLCHKCGWPFPNPHPSAKHRRAHKKVCGTIEGYKRIEPEGSNPRLAVSNDDDDQRTPSPKIQGSVKEQPSSGRVGEKSIASDDEVFTDAATEFSDSGVSPVMKERIKELDKDVEKLLNADMNESQPSKIDAIADIFVQVNDTESRQENFGIAKHQSESGKSSFGTRIEAFSLGSQFDSSPIESRTPEVLVNERNSNVISANEDLPVASGGDVVDIDKPMTCSIDSHGTATRDVSKLEFSLEDAGQQSSDALTQESLMHKVDEEKESKLEATSGKSSGSLTLEIVVQEHVTTNYMSPMGDGQTSAQSCEIHKSCSLVAPSDAPTMDIQNIQMGEEFYVHSSLQNANSEDFVAEQCDTKSAVSAEEVRQAADSCEGETNEDNEINKSENSVTDRNETSKDPLHDELSAKEKTIQEHPVSSSKSEDDQDHERVTAELMDMGRYESTAVAELMDTEAAHSAAPCLSESGDLDCVPEKVDIARGSTEQAYSGLHKCENRSSQEASHGSETGSVTDAVESADRGSSHLASLENSGEAARLHAESEVSNKSCATLGFMQTKEAVYDFEASQDEGDCRFENPHGGVSAIDILVASNSRGDNLEDYQGSTSEFSRQSDSTPADAGGLPFSVPQPPEKSVDSFQIPKDETSECHVDKADASESSGNCVSPDAAHDIQPVQNIQQPKPEDLQTGLLPSLPNVVNESESGRKNAETIADIQSQSTAKQHSHLKDLLGEAKSPNTKHMPAETRSDAPLAKGTALTTLNAILLSEESDQATHKDMEKEWNSPARYPSQIKKEKRKGKPYWVPFVCCSSVHRDF